MVPSHVACNIQKLRACIIHTNKLLTLIKLIRYHLKDAASNAELAEFFQNFQMGYLGKSFWIISVEAADFTWWLLVQSIVNLFQKDKHINCNWPLFHETMLTALLGIWQNGHTGTGKCIFRRFCRQCLKAISVGTFLFGACLLKNRGSSCNFHVIGIFRRRFTFLKTFWMISAMAAEVFRKKIGGSPSGSRAFLLSKVAKISRRFSFEILKFVKSGFFGSRLKGSFDVKIEWK